MQKPADPQRVVEAVALAEYRALISKLGSVPVSSSPKELQTVMDAVVRDAAPIVEEFKLQMD